jgi:hypothetical protein
VHVAECGVNTTLGSDCVTSCGEQLGDAGRVEASLGKTEGRTQTGTAGTDDDGVVLMVLVRAQVNPLFSSNIARIPTEGHTMTGYLLLTNGDASFARSGPLAMTRAIDRQTCQLALFLAGCASN